jgi:tRNA G18 (ribose-2'-O)-methylase SpoU
MKKYSMEDLNRLSNQEFQHVKKMPVTVVLDNVRSLNNIGSVFRTSDAFRIEKILLCGITAQPPHREIHKTALGATETVSWEYFEESIDAILSLKEEGYEVMVVEQVEASKNLINLDPVPDRKIAVVFGHEVHGVEQGIVDIADICVEIPQMGTKHSLNISVSAGIVLWSLFKNMRWDNE